VKRLSCFWKGLWKEESGQAVTEYGLILGIIAVGVCSALFYMREPLGELYQNLSRELSKLAEM
jgi:pilus assembly protein Flp/PilA